MPEIGAGSEGVRDDANVFHGLMERAKKELAKREAAEDAERKEAEEVQKKGLHRKGLRLANVALVTDTFERLQEGAKEELARREIAEEVKREEAEDEVPKQALRGMEFRAADLALATNLFHGLQERAKDELARRGEVKRREEEDVRQKAPSRMGPRTLPTDGFDGLREKAREELARREVVEVALKKDAAADLAFATGHFDWLQQRARLELVMREEAKRKEADEAEKRALSRMGLHPADIVLATDLSDGLQEGAPKELAKNDAAEKANVDEADAAQNKALSRMALHLVALAPETGEASIAVASCWPATAMLPPHAVDPWLMHEHSMPTSNTTAVGM